MNYIQFPYFAETIDGQARVKFTDFNKFELLRSTVIKGKELYSKESIKCNDSSYWIEAPSDINKDFYYEVIDGTSILEKLYTNVQIINQERHFDKTLIKTGRRFEL